MSIRNNGEFLVDFEVAGAKGGLLAVNGTESTINFGLEIRPYL